VLGEDSIVEGDPTRLCQICDRLRLIPDHSSTFQRTRPSGACLATASTYAHLRRLRPRSEMTPWSYLDQSADSHWGLDHRYLTPWSNEPVARNCLAISTLLSSRVLGVTGWFHVLVPMASSISDSAGKIQAPDGARSVPCLPPHPERSCPRHRSISGPATTTTITRAPTPNCG